MSDNRSMRQALDDLERDEKAYAEFGEWPIYSKPWTWRGRSYVEYDPSRETAEQAKARYQRANPPETGIERYWREQDEARQLALAQLTVAMPNPMRTYTIIHFTKGMVYDSPDGWC